MVEPNRRRLTVGQAPNIGAFAKDATDNKTVLHEQLKALWNGQEEFDNIVCVHSKTDGELKKKRSFAEKDREASDKKACDSSPIQGVEFTCKKGLKPESPNQDSFVVVHLPSKWSLYGVFDGHGPNGHDVSDFAVKALVTTFFENTEFASKTGDAFTQAFIECQQQIEKAKVDAQSSGSTCTMAFHNIATDDFTLAHVGDSRGVLYCTDKGKNELSGDKNLIKHETEDHKPNLPAEKQRIERNGGRVVFDGYYNYRVFAKAGMYPGLNMSRALGDIVAHKEAGLTAEPEIKQLNLKEHRSKEQKLTLLLCSDGVWEFIESKDALKQAFADQKNDSGSWPTAVPTEPQPLKKGVESLAKKSWDAWMQDSDNEISDDITVITAIL